MKNTEFTFIHYLSIKTAYDNNPNFTIYLYNYVEPTNNIWWNLSKSMVKIILTTPPEHIFNNKLNSYAHKADIIRLQKLIVELLSPFYSRSIILFSPFISVT